ncbi:2-keto-3-deoxygluconate-6-phosphate aldolase [Spiroplasma sp. NBRC 100390]|uniref:bifunctional 4-hydroxy-2-oxoglutarate aldolase/2-dehydro-3-deoxy-phosphogluconate aldolase n=1 Tax=unclassified Spiroplasma TaxID=2637901 RepID=UPI000892A48D|nr:MULTISPECIES: bifunctional 4-hydroxy-2-oxoglutarate aldolase/2-dehydro-3-deoxy-phosphogluconate aldolase [unclassified Spiroplasma]AOX43790.1 2-keto-3-deoxygluconate-6-phosphate aldolase [Spiroplasma sp. TU-14]APE13260.1 2-keto-3-deoxygluconate-6-phosphate aldolase [Spiroplasma sp. NBRC 100390]
MNNLPKVLEQKVFYVIRNQDYNVAQQICEMLINLQVTCLELTFTIPKVELLIKALRKKYPTILIGAGTVLTLAEAILAAEAGAHFLVGPVFNRAVSDFCHQKGLLYIPGAMTLQEVTNIVNANWEIIKIFPANAFKLNFIQTLKTFFPTKIYMASGGINLTNLKEAKDLGYDLVAVGAFVTGDINTKILEQEKIQTMISTISQEGG